MSRLADKILDPQTDWAIYPKFFSKDTDTLSGLRILKEAIVTGMDRATLICADNVSDYYFASDRDDWGTGSLEALSCVAPPLPTVFIETMRPPRVREAGKDVPQDEVNRISKAWGCLFQFVSEEVSRQDGFRYVPANLVEWINSLPPGSVRWLGRALMVLQSPMDTPAVLGCSTFAIGPTGNVLNHFTTGLPGRLDDDERDDVVDFQRKLMYPLFLAIMFMNCKNVVRRVVNPPERLNRARIRRGKRPFLRYHVLDIETMKKVLKTEGGVETNGLKKALHIVRGHFATYTEDRPLFGKFPGTFWMPAHTRGSLKNGVVSKDYRVVLEKESEVAQ